MPLLPCLLLQTFCDARNDRKFGLRRAYTCRFVSTGLALTLAVGPLQPRAVKSLSAHPR